MGLGCYKLLLYVYTQSCVSLHIHTLKYMICHQGKHIYVSIYTQGACKAAFLYSVQDQCRLMLTEDPDVLLCSCVLLSVCLLLLVENQIQKH